jgi:hypothetical protein
MDPVIKKLLIKYKIDIKTPALTYFSPESKSKMSDAALTKVNIKETKKILSEQSMLMRSPRFLNMSTQLVQIYNETLKDVSLFVTKFDPKFIQG